MSMRRLVPLKRLFKLSHPKKGYVKKAGVSCRFECKAQAKDCRDELSKNKSLIPGFYISIAEDHWRYK